MATIRNLIQVYSVTVGGGPLTLGAAVAGFNTFALGGVLNGDTVSYGIFDYVGGNHVASEVGRGVYNAAGPTLTRNVIDSTNGGAALNLTGNEVVYVTVLREDLDHTSGSILNVGVNTHGQIDLHIANVANPHAVTAAQVGAPALFNPSVVGNLVSFSNVTGSQQDSGITSASVTAAIGASHAAVTLDANADTLLSIAGQALGLDTQTANRVWAGPTTGAAAVPTFRALVAADIPALSYGDISGTGVAGQVAEFVTNTKTLQAAKLIGPAANILTITNSAASTLAMAITAGKTLTLTAADNYNLTVPASGTTALLATANVFTAAQTIKVDNASAFLIQKADATVIANIDSTTGGTQFGYIGMATGSGHTFFTGNTGAIIVRTDTGGSPQFFWKTGVTNRYYMGANLTSTGDWALYGYASPAGYRIYFTPAGLMGVGIGFSTPLTRLHVVETTTTTNAPLDVFRIEGRVSTAATGFTVGGGVAQSFFAESATDGSYRQLAQISAIYTDATDATRKAKLSLSAYDTAARLGLEIEASGTAAKIGLYGATPVVRATNAGAAAAFVTNTSLIANDTGTFGGYTIGQIAQALINIGVLT